MTDSEHSYSPTVADVPPHLRGAVSPDEWARICAERPPRGDDGLDVAIPTSEHRLRLTVAQARYLAEIRAAGVKRYNGRARRPLEALKRAGLIEYEYDLVPQARGKWTESFVARPR